MDNLPIQKISIQGPTLAFMIQRFASSPGDVDGLLFGHVSRLPPPDLPDDDPSSALPSSSSSSSPSSSLSVSITGHFCSGQPLGFYDALGRIDDRSLRRALCPDHRPPDSPLLGWFSGRRNTPLRPSMREFAVSLSLSRTLKTLTLDDGTFHPHSSLDRSHPPCIFILLSSSSTSNLSVHTHEHRAFELRWTPRGATLEPRSLDVVNVGPSFRGQYGSFSPESPFPWMPCRVAGVKEEAEDKGLNQHRRAAREHPVLDRLVEGFGVEKLGHLVGPGASEYTSKLEELYDNMLRNLEGLARQAEKGNARVLEQEKRNQKLRNKIAGLD